MFELIIQIRWYYSLITQLIIQADPLHEHIIHTIVFPGHSRKISTLVSSSITPNTHVQRENGHVWFKYIIPNCSEYHS